MLIFAPIGNLTHLERDFYASIYRNVLFQMKVFVPGSKREPTRYWDVRASCPHPYQCISESVEPTLKAEERFSAMTLRRSSSYVVIAALATTLAATTALAQSNERSPNATGQTVIPYAEQKFQGNVGTSYKDSDPAQFPAPIKAPQGAPNVLLVLLDDVGFGQFSVTGGGVPSPYMDALAKDGLLFNRFHTTAVCSPSRAALLTGRNHHVAGTGNITEVATGYDGYTGIIPKDTATVAEILRENGYITSWVGKNHNTPIYETSVMGPFDHWPNGLGFDYFYGFMAGDTNQVRPYLYENQTALGTPTDNDYYLSVDLADHALTWLEKTEAVRPDKPWFMYYAPAATHAPHQAPKVLIDQFKGKFDKGWDVYREETFERQKKLGIIPQNAVLTERPKSLPAWDSLSADQKRLYERMMEVFAAYGNQVDHEVGRVLDYVAKLPDADNTMIIYIVGDNGASAEGGFDGTLNENAFFNAYLMKTDEMLSRIDEIGTEMHFNHFPAGWAHAMDTPFQWTQAGREPSGWHPQSDDCEMAGQDQARWRNPQSVLPFDRRRADHPGGSWN